MYAYVGFSEGIHSRRINKWSKIHEAKTSTPYPSAALPVTVHNEFDSKNKSLNSMWAYNKNETQ